MEIRKSPPAHPSTPGTPVSGPAPLVVLRRSAALGDGRLFTARRIGAFGSPSGPPLVFWSREDHAIYSVVDRPILALPADTPATSADKPVEPEKPAAPESPRLSGPSLEDQEKAADRLIKFAPFAGGAFVATELARLGGAPVAAAVIAKQAGIPTDAATLTTLARQIDQSSLAAPGSQAWKVFKLALVALTLFGTTPSVLRYVFGATPPRAAWAIAYSLNLALIVICALWLFGLWPFANHLPPDRATALS